MIEKRSVEMRLRIGTRGSSLALWQARHVASTLEKANPEVRCELAIIKTKGDRILDAPLAHIGGKGLFTKEIEDSLLDRSIHLAVHSLKDLPTELPDGLSVGAFLRRDDPRDVFLSNDSSCLEDLRRGARIGTSSLRRRAFILNKYPQMEIVSIRGNLDTRVRKIESENLAGVVLAAAGLLRMGYSNKITSYLDPHLFIPAIGQGALAVEIREDDTAVRQKVAVLNDSVTQTCVEVERAFLRRMGGGCQVPMAAHCIPKDGGYYCVAAVIDPDGHLRVQDEYAGNSIDVEEGSYLADKLLARGASGILKGVLGKEWEPGKV